MNRYTLVPIAVALLATGCGREDDTSADGVADPDKAAIDAVFAAWDKPETPGCAVAVAKHGELLYSGGYGYANLDYGIPITPQTTFDVASITKQFNAAGITMLALEGKLSLDDSVRQWLPELPEYAEPITLRHMMYHTSGLRDYLNLFPLAGRGDYFPISHPQILDMMSRQRALIFDPGDEYRYSNTAYMLLAQVLERAGGQSLGDLAQERIFDPLGMTGSHMYDDAEEIILHRAIGYDRNDDGGHRVVHNYNFDVVGDGQLYSTAEDLLRWDEFLHGADKPDIYPHMMTEGKLNDGEPTGYAQGLRLRDYRGLATVGHSGSSWGFRSELVRFIEPALSIAVACNSDYSRPGELAQQVAEHYLADQMQPADSGGDSGDEEPPEAAAERPAIRPEQLAAYAGEFFSYELDATYRFAVDGGDLVVRIEQEPPLAVTPVGDDRFEIRFYDQGLSGPQTAKLEFDRNRAGDVTGFGLSSGSERGLVFERL